MAILVGCKVLINMGGNHEYLYPQGTQFTQKIMNFSFTEVGIINHKSIDVVFILQRQIQYEGAQCFQFRHSVALLSEYMSVSAVCG